MFPHHFDAGTFYVHGQNLIHFLDLDKEYGGTEGYISSTFIKHYTYSMEDSVRLFLEHLELEA